MPFPCAPRAFPRALSDSFLEFSKCQAWFKAPQRRSLLCLRGDGETEAQSSLVTWLGAPGLGVAALEFQSWHFTLEPEPWMILCDMGIWTHFTDEKAEERVLGPAFHCLQMSRGWCES